MHIKRFMIEFLKSTRLDFKNGKLNDCTWDRNLRIMFCDKNTNICMKQVEPPKQIMTISVDSKPIFLPNWSSLNISANLRTLNLQVSGWGFLIAYLKHIY